MSNIVLKPTFFIVGAAKSGTTSLANALNNHPDLFIPKIKEPMYFIPDTGVTSLDKYLSLYTNVEGARVLGDASTGYLFDIETPSKIYDFNKDSKIIIVLRNPIDMMFSFWQYMGVSGSEQLGFIEALNDITQRKLESFKGSCVGWYANYLYIERARYGEQIKRYLDVFPRRQIKIILFEDMISSQSEVLNEVLDFLGVSSAIQPDLQKANESGLPRSALLKHVLDRRGLVIAKIIPTKYKTRLKQWLMKVNTSNKKKYITYEERLLAAHLLEFDKVLFEVERLMQRRIILWKV